MFDEYRRTIEVELSRVLFWGKGNLDDQKVEVKVERQG
jgi:hypothetical protein